MKEIVRRVQRMELYFDMVSQAFSIDPVYVRDDEHIKSMLNVLVEYYESGRWMADYQADEKGELPSDLKRGVLSEDGLWNLLSNIQKQ